MDYAELQSAYELDVYPKRPLTILRGQNARVWDDRDREYIDCVCGHGVANLGHGHPRLVAAVREQAGRLITLSNVFYNDQRALLLEKLVRLAPARLGRAFLCNSGAEAIEGALKFARLATGRPNFVCAMRGFHGRTLGALSATYKPEYRLPFEPLLPGFEFVPFNDVERLADKVGARTAAVILEPIQGETGVMPGSREYFREVRRICDERGALLIVDEVQTGFCRTGAMFACELYEIDPDIMCLAKAIAGGLPMGAILSADEIRIPAGTHGSTFGGNPLSCAAANAAIDVMVEDDLAGQARAKGARFAERLRAGALGQVREVRQIGLMVGLELKDKAVPAILALLDAGVLTFPAGSDVIRIYPPLTIEPELLDVVAARIATVLG
jgi:acetylornithine/LysW-gamma-L-lysine aminotransferase